MTLTLTLQPEVEQWLIQRAAQRGLLLEEYAQQVLHEHLSQVERERREELMAVLESWDKEDADAEEGYDTEFFQMLDQDRLSDRKLFPPELKGISW